MNKKIPKISILRPINILDISNKTVLVGIFMELEVCMNGLFWPKIINTKVKDLLIYFFSVRKTANIPST